MPSSMARATPRSRSAGAPRTISPPTSPQPKASADTRNPVRPSTRYSMAVSYITDRSLAPARALRYSLPRMRHARLGRTGLSVSRLCLGTMTFGLQCDEATSRAILDRAAAGGITFLDAADVYPVGGGFQTAGRTEEIVGRWLEGRRHEFIVATKCGGAMSERPWDRGTSRKHVLDAIDASLRRLRT